ncbi:DUF169 domain-containing protein [bacterium]|nr:DUF169 domain-containing protein [candidate division CSSED10-310 bacterium]
METVKKMESTIGGRWRGVSLFYSDYEKWKKYLSPPVERFCETFDSTDLSTRLLDPGKFTCPGASYAFGYGEGIKQDMVRKFVDEKGYSSKYAENLINETPHCTDQLKAIGIDLDKQPDVLIAKLQPEQIMKLIDIYQKVLEKAFTCELTSVISLCANIAIKTTQTNDLTISFGCEDARTAGNLSRDRLFAGLPYTLATTMMKEF